MLNKNGERELAYVVVINDVTPISGYDRVELAHVGGWTIVVGKGEFKVGDPAIYFEIDSKLPEVKPFTDMEFLAKKHYKVKTQKMCKSISQGLLMSAENFGWKPFKGVVDKNTGISNPEYPGIADEENQRVFFANNDSRFLTKILGVTYAEAEDNKRKAKPADKYKVMAQRHGKLFAKQPFRWLMQRDWGKRLLFVFFGKKKDKSNWPEWVKKTDEERIQNCPHALGWKVKWTATEKVDGTSTTFTIRRGKHRWNNPEFFVCSRNVCFRTGNENVYYDTNVYTEMAQKYWMRDVLTSLLERYPNEEWITIQGETYGLGIQKNDYGLKEHKLAVFNLIFSSTGRVSTELMKQIMDEYSIPCVPILAERVELPNDVDAVVAMADGKSELYDGMREGIVFRSEDGKQSFKAVSNEYLLKCH